MLSLFDLLHKYDVPGPRYTSYPTVPIWSENVGASDYAQNLRAVKGDEALSLYFHLPFCEQLCHFCGCMQVITKDHSRSKGYVDVLLKEIDLVAEQLENCERVVSQIHFGGGTPNFCQPEEISEIMQKIRDRFTVLDDAEIAIEMHPRTSTKEFCDNLKTEGFNRISLGVQDFNENVQKLIHRFQTHDMTKDMLDHLRALGFSHFNFDLIYGLPGQTQETFKDTLEKTIALRPNRLAVYSYAHVPWVRPVQRSFKDSDLPNPEQKLRLFELAYNMLRENAYHPVGMDHFADESDELYKAVQENSVHRNFMGYSTRADAHQIGFGVSSISYVNGNYFQNAKKLPEYLKIIEDSKELTSFRGFILSAEDKLRRELITELMCHLRINKENFSKRFGINFNEHFKNELALLSDFKNDELLEESETELKVIGNGHLTIRNIAMCFDQHLDEIKKNARNPVFSRTV